MKTDVVIIVVGLALAATVWIGWSQFAALRDHSKKDGGQTVCTLDARQCPDGTYVGRTGPNCEFVCP